MGFLPVSGLLIVLIFLHSTQCLESDMLTGTSLLVLTKGKVIFWDFLNTNMGIIFF